MDHCHLYILIYFIYRYYSINKGFLQEMGVGPRDVRAYGAFGPVGS